jgi:DNA-binding NtrC family response regulator
MSASRSVLVVDDEPSVRGMLGSVLNREGFEVHLAASAEEASEIFRRVEPDAVLADVVMPGMDGVTLLEELLRLDADVPVLLMTGYGATDAAVDAMRRGAVDYITKPFKRRRVVDALQRALSERSRTLARRAAQADASGEANLEEALLEQALAKRMTLRELSDLYIDRILSMSQGNKMQAARALGINRRTLYRRGVSAQERES